MALWLSENALVLASKSEARRAMLIAAGIPVEAVAADIDERGIETKAGETDPQVVARLLAREKAKAVSAAKTGRVVIGADQTLALGARRFSKPADRAAAREQLCALRGRDHMLCAAVAVVSNGETLFEHCSVARLKMRDFSDGFLDAYLEAAGGAVTASVGAFQLEKIGVQLFERIDGDHFTILGMPLLPLLDYLREAKMLAA
jgi:septum formation protein